MGQLALSAFPMPLPPASLCFPPKKARASVMPSLPGERGVVLHVPAGDTLGTPPGMGRGGGALLGTRGGQTKGKVWLCPAVAWSPLAPGGGIFVLYFSHVSFPEPGSSMYHPETVIKNKPLAVFFS